jgi:hypothetical protein
MRIVITESQAKHLIEDLYNPLDNEVVTYSNRIEPSEGDVKEQNILDRIKTGSQNLYKDFDNSIKSNPMLNNSKMMGGGPAGSAIGSLQMDPHTRNSILEALWSVVPVVGPFISAVVGVDDAHKYYNEGNKKEAVIVGVLSVLPLVGQIASKFPIIKELGQKGMNILAGKLVNGNGLLSQAEASVMNIINNNSNFITNQIKTIANSPVTKHGVDYAMNQVGQKVIEKGVGNLYDLNR